MPSQEEPYHLHSCEDSYEATTSNARSRIGRQRDCEEGPCNNGDAMADRKRVEAKRNLSR